MRHPNSERFHQILKEHGELHDKKQADYGKGNDPFANVRASVGWGVPGWVGAMIRLNDKVERLKSFAERGALANESVEDSLRDIAVYATIALVLYEQESATRRNPAGQSSLGAGVTQHQPLYDGQTTQTIPLADWHSKLPHVSGPSLAPLVWSENFPDRTDTRYLLGREVDEVEDHPGQS